MCKCIYLRVYIYIINTHISWEKKHMISDSDLPPIPMAHDGNGPYHNLSSARLLQTGAHH